MRGEMVNTINPSVFFLYFSEKVKKNQNFWLLKKFVPNLFSFKKQK